MADSTVTTTNVQGFAPQIAPYVEGVLGGAAKAVEKPYQSYADWAQAHNLQGNQVAAFDKLQNTAFTGAEGLAPEQSSMQSAQGLEALSRQAGATGYAPTQFGNQFNYQGGQFDQNAAQQYMSPYMQSVVDIQKREAQRQSGIQGTQQQAQAAQAGAFGGGRDAIMRAERERNLGQQMGDIQATGSQAAFQQAQQQYNADQARNLQAANYGAQYGLAGQQESERSKQFGANLGLQGIQAGLQGYGALGSQGQNLYGQNIGNLQLQNAFGTQKQQQAQNLIDTSQQNYAAEQNYPYKQIGFMSDIINRAPVSNLGSQVYTPPPSLISQAAGVGTALTGASKLFGKAKGGSIKQGAGLSDLAMYQMSRG